MRLPSCLRNKENRALQRLRPIYGNEDKRQEDETGEQSVQSQHRKNSVPVKRLLLEYVIEAHQACGTKCQYQPHNYSSVIRRQSYEVFPLQTAQIPKFSPLQTAQIPKFFLSKLHKFRSFSSPNCTNPEVFPLQTAQIPKF